MEKLVYFPSEVLELIFQQMNHHMVLNLIPLHSKFCDIGRKKLYKFIHIYFNDSEIKSITYTGWRMHKNIVNDFTKKYTIIESSKFYTSMIENKIDRFQKIQHLSIENDVFLGHIDKLSIDFNRAAPALLERIVKYFKNIDCISFALANNQLEPNKYRSSNEALEAITFQKPNIYHELFDRVLVFGSNNPLSYDFLYNNLKSFKFQFGLVRSRKRRYHHGDIDQDLLRSIDVFNSINLFKNLEDLHLAFKGFINLMDPLLLEKLNKIDCKLKTLQIIFWGKHKELRGIQKKRELHIKAKPRKWLFTLDKFFRTDEITSLTLDHYSKKDYRDVIFFEKANFEFEKFEFWKILANANLSKLRNLCLSSQYLDLKWIDVSKLQKLIIRTDVANYIFATEIAMLYLSNPNLRISWWPRLTNQYRCNNFDKFDNIQIYTPHYIQVISCQWPLYFFKKLKSQLKRRSHFSTN
ncbi:uncharacterized protein KGF55_003293 [Candida pseudojiufengensis]|uniref:uncharacterized protein n=1 Tax=Candida pseudojiufengensis TaxID=497109 RepID=UPI002224AD94|nr:uncharacterized protein KGF55_003293 [Candida pseudojiufengensis]KAI5962217.1 hypothetical protein KGF55_003293 [Candida pseudojiufengensis]